MIQPTNKQDEFAAIKAAGIILGKDAYAADVLACPKYPDGGMRPTWEHLGEITRWSWERTL